MKNTIKILVFLISLIGYGQQSDFKSAWLEKWEHSKDYLIAFAEAMPEEFYDYKPTEGQMTFEEQLLHIDGNITWLGTSYFNLIDEPVPELNTKKDIIKKLKADFDKVSKAISQIEDFSEDVRFFAGAKSKLQILNLLQDHVTHHRGQLVVYFNLKGIKPPKYVGW
ncbi:MAG: DinB family protein [Leeuwenhoekiella sp.]